MKNINITPEWSWIGKSEAVFYCAKLVMMFFIPVNNYFLRVCREILVCMSMRGRIPEPL